MIHHIDAFNDVDLSSPWPFLSSSQSPKGRPYLSNMINYTYFRQIRRMTHRASIRNVSNVYHNQSTNSVCVFRCDAYLRGDPWVKALGAEKGTNGVSVYQRSWLYECGVVNSDDCVSSIVDKCEPTRCSGLSINKCDIACIVQFMSGH